MAPPWPPTPFLTIALLGALLRPGRDSKADEPEISFVSWINTLYVRELARREAAEAGAGAALSDERSRRSFPRGPGDARRGQGRTPPPTEPKARSCTCCSLGRPAEPQIEIVSITDDGDGRAKGGVSGSRQLSAAGLDRTLQPDRQGLADRRYRLLRRQATIAAGSPDRTLLVASNG